MLITINRYTGNNFRSALPLFNFYSVTRSVRLITCYLFSGGRLIFNDPKGLNLNHKELSHAK